MTGPTRQKRRTRGIPLAAALAASSALGGIARAADPSLLAPGNVVGAFAAVGLVALAGAGVLFAIGAIQRAKTREAQLSAELAAARRAAAERTALLLATDTPLYLYPPGAARPRIYGPDQGRLERVLRGPDGLALAEAIKKLRASGAGMASEVTCMSKRTWRPCSPWSV